MKKLGDNTVTVEQIKKSMIHLHSPYLDSTSADSLTRLKLGKTLFNNQLFAIGLIDEKTCKTCIREYDLHTQEDYQHTLFQCPATQTVIRDITNTFFPNHIKPFNTSDILLSVNSDKHKLYKGPTGQELASLIWDLFQVYILKCRVSQTTPISTTAIFEIKSQLNRILKILPKRKLSAFIKTSPELQNILVGNLPSN